MKIDIKQIWNFIWHDDSAASWIVNVILAFVIIKFLVFPGMSFALGTSHPIVAVVSGSMEHDITKEYRYFGNPITGPKQWSGQYFLCDQKFSEDKHVNFDGYWEICGPWYEKNSISQEMFDEFKMSNGFNKGDLIILHTKENAEVGDVLVFWGTRSDPIIHRIVEVTDDGYITKGDHNSREDGTVNPDNVIGKALFRVPYLGWIKIWFVQFISIFIGG